jgi:hypothetical protein
MLNNKEFELNLKRTLEIVSNTNLKEEYRMEVAESFCETYIYFDSSKFDKYFE